MTLAVMQVQVLHLSTSNKIVALDPKKRIVLDMTYVVSIFKRFPAHNERNGFRYIVTATAKRKAIAEGRRQATNDGHVGFGQGRYSISATEASE